MKLVLICKGIIKELNDIDKIDIERRKFEYYTFKLEALSPTFITLEFEVLVKYSNEVNDFYTTPTLR